MEKEQIIKALECCGSKHSDIGKYSCKECPLNGQNFDEGACYDEVLHNNALALIKELTEENEKLKSIDISKDIVMGSLAEENEKLRNAKVIYETVDYCADDLAKALEENKRLTEENETLKDNNEHLAVFLAEAKSDTLNDMQTRFAMHFGTYRPTDEVKVTEVFKLLKKISGEMLYEEEEEEDK